MIPMDSLSTLLSVVFLQQPWHRGPLLNSFLIFTGTTNHKVMIFNWMQRDIRNIWIHIWKLSSSPSWLRRWSRKVSVSDRCKKKLPLYLRHIPSSPILHKFSPLHKTNIAVLKDLGWKIFEGERCNHSLLSQS